MAESKYNTKKHRDRIFSVLGLIIPTMIVSGVYPYWINNRLPPGVGTFLEGSDISVKGSSAQPDKLISMRKLTDYLKSAKIDTRDISDNRYLYSQGRNILADLVVIAAVSGEFDPDEPVDPPRLSIPSPAPVQPVSPANGTTAITSESSSTRTTAPYKNSD